MVLKNSFNMMELPTTAAVGSWIPNLEERREEKGAEKLREEEKEREKKEEVIEIEDVKEECKVSTDF